jgi:hypothetical protein
MDHERFLDLMCYALEALRPIAEFSAAKFPDKNFFTVPEIDEAQNFIEELLGRRGADIAGGFTERLMWLKPV